MISPTDPIALFGTGLVLWNPLTPTHFHLDAGFLNLPNSLPMAEYSPLISALLEEEEDECKKPPSQELSRRYVLLFSLLTAVIAIFTAAAFHLSVLSASH
jgi:hypothetical protein